MADARGNPASDEEDILLGGESSDHFANAAATLAEALIASQQPGGNKGNKGKGKSKLKQGCRVVAKKSVLQKILSTEQQAECKMATLSSRALFYGTYEPKVKGNVWSIKFDLLAEPVSCARSRFMAVPEGSEEPEETTREKLDASAEDAEVRAPCTTL